MSNFPSFQPSETSKENSPLKIMNTPAPAPKNAEQHAEGILARVFKGDISAVKEFLSNPLEHLKKEFITMLQNTFGDVKWKLDDLKTDIATNITPAPAPAPAPASVLQTTNLPVFEGRGGIRGQEISDNEAKNWIRESKLEANYKTATDFFVQKWLTLQQSVGIVANLHHESNLRINAVGDGGKAKWIAQWHPDRRAKILQATGIDVSKAPLEKQLEAVWWEITKGGEQKTYQALIKCKTEEEAARQFCLLFERPAQKERQAQKRAIAAWNMMAKIENGQRIS